MKTMTYNDTQSGIKAVSIPRWSEMLGMGGGRITNASQGFERIPILRRAVNIIADSVVELPHMLTSKTAVGEDGSAAEMPWPFANDFDTLLGETVRAYLIEGAAYWLKQKNDVVTRSLQWLNPTTMRQDFKAYGKDGKPIIQFTQQGVPRTAGQPNTWTSEDMVYFRQWQLGDDVAPGKSAVACVLDAACLHYYITRFGKNTFENGAMPVVVMSIEQGGNQDDIKRAEGLFQQMMQGIQNAFRVIAVRGIWKPQIVTPPLNTLAMPELAGYALGQVAIGMGIPETWLTDAANFATAEKHDLQFWRNTVVPLANFLAAVINEQLLAELGLELAFQPEQLDVFQADENERAQSLVSLTDAGLSLDWAMQILGYDLPSGVTYEMIASMQEAKRAQAQALAEAQANRASMQLQGLQANQPPKDVTPQGDASAKRKTLRAWERFTSKRMQAGKAMRAFEAPDLPRALKGAIDGALEVATAADASLIFGEAAEDKGIEAYP